MDSGANNLIRRARQTLLAGLFATFGFTAVCGQAHHVVLTSVESCADHQHRGPDGQRGDDHCALCHFQKIAGDPSLVSAPALEAAELPRPPAREPMIQGVGARIATIAIRGPPDVCAA